MSDLEAKLRELVNRNQHDGWARDLGINDLDKIVSAAANLGRIDGAEHTRERAATVAEDADLCMCRCGNIPDAIRALPLPSEES
jgi:hypothetical protein